MLKGYTVGSNEKLISTRVDESTEKQLNKVIQSLSEYGIITTKSQISRLIIKIALEDRSKLEDRLKAGMMTR